MDKFTGTDMARAHAITYETLMEDEENQILGVNHIADLGAVGPSFVTLFSVTEFAYLIKWGEVSMTNIYLFYKFNIKCISKCCEWRF